MKYAGYSNAGLGLKKAVALFSAEERTEKHIILISDGEIELKRDEESEQSKEEYHSASKAAVDKGIKIHIIIVEGMAEEEIEILDAAGMTGGEAYAQGKDGTLSRIAGEVVSEQPGTGRGRRLGFERSMVTRMKKEEAMKCFLKKEVGQASRSFVLGATAYLRKEQLPERIREFMEDFREVFAVCRQEKEKEKGREVRFLQMSLLRSRAFGGCMKAIGYSAGRSGRRAGGISGASVSRSWSGSAWQSWQTAKGW